MVDTKKAVTEMRIEEYFKELSKCNITAHMQTHTHTHKHSLTCVYTMDMTCLGKHEKRKKCEIQKIWNNCQRY